MATSASKTVTGNCTVTVSTSLKTVTVTVHGMSTAFFSSTYQFTAYYTKNGTSYGSTVSVYGANTSTIAVPYNGYLKLYCADWDDKTPVWYGPYTSNCTYSDAPVVS